MEELEQEITNAVEGQVDETPAEPAENNTDLRGELSKLNPDNPEPPQELWKQSNQFKQGLWKTPDDIMNSVQYYEKKFQPLEQSLKRMGFNEPADLEQAFKEYQEKLPVYQENENTINLLNALLQNDVYGSKLRGVFDEIRKALL